MDNYNEAAQIGRLKDRESGTIVSSRSTVACNQMVPGIHVFYSFTVGVACKGGFNPSFR